MDAPPPLAVMEACFLDKRSEDVDGTRRLDLGVLGLVGIEERATPPASSRLRMKTRNANLAIVQKKATDFMDDECCSNP